MAVRDDGSLWAWGNGGYGCFGGGLPIWGTYLNTPTRIGTDNDWALAEAASGMQGYFTVAVKTNGSLWTVGSNGWGVLGPDYAPGTSQTNTFVKQGDGFRVPQ
jgi:alpha-tubulin suppressor-like RCC1 family protein